MREMAYDSACEITEETERVAEDHSGPIAALSEYFIKAFFEMDEIDILRRWYDRDTGLFFSYEFETINRFNEHIDWLSSSPQNSASFIHDRLCRLGADYKTEMKVVDTDIYTRQMIHVCKASDVDFISVIEISNYPELGYEQKSF